MPDPLRLLFVYAHPDDETLGTGGAAARYAAEGVEVYLVTATRGERGWAGPEAEDPGLAELGRLRTAELQAAARQLGIREVSFLDYLDGDLDQADPTEAIDKVAAHVRRIRPQVVVTFGPDGAYGHPDHIAISQFTQAALVRAAAPGAGGPAHTVSKFYYVVDRRAVVEKLQASGVFIQMEIDGVMRQQVAWDDWAISTWVDTAAYTEHVWTAIQCHQTQLPTLGPLNEAGPAAFSEFFAVQTFYRAYSLVNGGRRVERDLFEGLRPAVTAPAGSGL